MIKEKEVAIEASKSSAKILMDSFRGKNVIHEKDFKELVSDVDLKSEKNIISKISENFPDHGITSEELGSEPGSNDYTWIIDPLDGTHNYVYGHPAYGISIALAKGDEVILGVINLPLYNEIYVAIKGEGSYLNGEKIEVSKRTIDKSYILYDPQLHKREDMFENLKKVYSKSFKLRIVGCAVTDATSVAAGRAEARIWHNTKTVDVAAGSIIVKEAGGKVTDFSGEPYKVGKSEVIVSNSIAHQDLIDLLK